MSQKSNIDYLIVGAGLYGATIARELTDCGNNCLIIDQRQHIAGNIYTDNQFGIDIHIYGPHIFHTNDVMVISFVQRFALWDTYIQNTIAKDDNNNLYHLPFNATTFYEIFGTSSQEAVKRIIDKEIEESGLKDQIPTNLEEQAIKLVGKTIYRKLIKNYTERQWNKPCDQLPPDIIKRLPLRFNFNNNYFNDQFQAIPRNGYTQFVENIIGDIPYLLDTRFNYEYWKDKVNKKIIYCGAVDELLDYKLGTLEWRSLKFDDVIYDYNGYNGQCTPIVNYVGENSDCTRTIEHMWFQPNKIELDENGTKKSVITKEIPMNWEKGKERFYPINDAKNNQLYERYCKMLEEEYPNIMLGGRLGKYKYYDMDDTIIAAIEDARKLMF